jgi:hypothetical protein
MFNKRFTLLLVFLSAAIISLLALNAVQAYATMVIGGSDDVTVSGNIKYSSPQTRYWSVAGSDFVLYNGTSSYTKWNGLIYGTTSTLIAKVHLPHGAVVTKMQIHYMDNSSNSMSVKLAR